jgi:hypothetical protein
MKKIVIIFCASILSIACNSKKQNPFEDYLVYGDSITTDGALTSNQMLDKYKLLKDNDTVKVKFSAVVNSVCQKKGCWMRLDLPNNQEAFVKFKDYGFFMPLNSAESEVIVHGKAFVSTESVAELKHYAKDAGKSQADIDAITEPEVTYSFEADGVLLKKQPINNKR